MRLIPQTLSTRAQSIQHLHSILDCKPDSADADCFLFRLHFCNGSLTTADGRSGWGSIDPGVGAGLFEKYDIFNDLDTNRQTISSFKLVCIPQHKRYINNYINKYEQGILILQKNIQFWYYFWALCNWRLFRTSPGLWTSTDQMSAKPLGMQATIFGACPKPG